MPNSVPTAIVRPSGLTSRLEGYQPVGMSPRKRAVPPGARLIHGHGVRAAERDVERDARSATRDGRRCDAGAALAEGIGGDRSDDGVRARIDDADVVRVAVGDEESRVRLVPREARRVQPTVTDATYAPAHQIDAATVPRSAMSRASTRTDSARGSQHCVVARSPLFGFGPPSTLTHACCRRPRRPPRRAAHRAPRSGAARRFRRRARRASRSPEAAARSLGARRVGARGHRDPPAM